MLKLELRVGEKEGEKKALERSYSDLPVLTRESPGKVRRDSVSVHPWRRIGQPDLMGMVSARSRGAGPM